MSPLYRLAQLTLAKLLNEKEKISKTRNKIQLKTYGVRLSEA